MARKKDTCPECGKPKAAKSKRCVECYSKLRGPAHHKWTGGRQINKFGYVIVYDPDRPRNHKGRYSLEHTLVMESFLGRQLHPNENVHHKNGVKDDNRIENLELWVKSQPPGQRVSDLVPWAEEILRRYKGVYLEANFIPQESDYPAGDE